MSTPTTICNLALDAIPAGRITSLDENSVEAKACRLHYPQVLGELLEMANWGFARARTPLTPVANDRPAEWPVAYQMPPFVAVPLSVVGPQTTAPNAVHHGWTANTNGHQILSAEAAASSGRFAISGDRIYSSQPQGMLEYISSEIFFDRSYALFRKALILHLAASLVMPISKDPKRRTALLQEAEVATQRAVAAAFNREGGQTYGDYLPEVVRAHTGMTNAPIISGGFTMVDPPANAETGLPPAQPPPPVTPPGEPTDPTGPGLYDFPDWSEEFEKLLVIPI